jgi:hypothetical protein
VPKLNGLDTVPAFGPTRMRAKSEVGETMASLVWLSASLLLLLNPTALTDVGVDEETATADPDGANSSTAAGAVKIGAMKAAMAATEKGPGFPTVTFRRSSLTAAEDTAAATTSGSLNDSDATTTTATEATTVALQQAAGGNSPSTLQPVVYMEIVKTSDLLKNSSQR